MIQKLVLDFKLPSLNEYTRIERGNKYAAANLKKTTEEQIYYEIKRQGLRTVKSPVRVGFTWLESSKRRDKDNVSFSKKYVLDALQAAKTLPNDNNRWIVGFTDDFIYGSKQGVIVTLEEVTEV